MNAAFDLLPLLTIAVLPVMFIVQFFNAHSRRAAWTAPARSTHAATTARSHTAVVFDLDTARTARNDAVAVPVAA